MELLGCDINHLARFCGGKLSLCTTLKLADQLLLRLEAMHKAGVIHNDLKPLNISMGLGATKDVVHVIDYGLATKLEEDEETGGFVLDMSQVRCLAHSNAHSTPPLAQPSYAIPNRLPHQEPVYC
jgi:serine/threonine protein kinase